MLYADDTLLIGAKSITLNILLRQIELESGRYNLKLNRSKCNHIDMKKAYTRGGECNFYQGYLGKITDFRKTDKIQGLGIYYITDIKYNDNEYKEATVALFSDENESVEIPYITVFRNGLSISFIEGTSYEASTILTTIYDYWVSIIIRFVFLCCFLFRNLLMYQHHY